MTSAGPGSAADSGELILRMATKHDLDDIVKVVQAGFPDDPEFDYRFPYRQKYPEDNWKYVREEYAGYLNQPNKFAVLVVTAPGEAANEMSRRPIALGVWDVSANTKPTSDGIATGINERRDANVAHMEEFLTTLGKGYDVHFSGYGEKQLHLWLLTTHPDFRRRGAGTMICQWGMEKAAAKGWVATVLSSRMGKLLYEHLGFKLLGTVRVQIEREDDGFTVWCLVHEKNKDQLGSF